MLGSWLRFINPLLQFSPRILLFLKSWVCELLDMNSFLCTADLHGARGIIYRTACLRARGLSSKAGTVPGT